MEHTLYFLPTGGMPQTADALLARVSPARRAKIAALRRAGDRENALLAAIAVRLCAAETLGAENRQLRFACTAWGKPYLVGAPEFCFSVAHTDGAIALAVSPIAVGADIERLRKAPRGVAERFFTPEEQAYCAGADDRFFEIWTRREALTKRTGTPLAETFAASRGGKTADSTTTRIFHADDCMLAVASDAAAAFSLCRLNADDLVRTALERLAPLG